MTYHIAAVIGLAQSNPFVENANFTAHHILRTCGYCMTDQAQRRQVLAYLERASTIMGWDTQHTIALLKDQWKDLDCPND